MDMKVSVPYYFSLNYYDDDDKILNIMSWYTFHYLPSISNLKLILVLGVEYEERA